MAMTRRVSVSQNTTQVGQWQQRAALAYHKPGLGGKRRHVGSQNEKTRGVVSCLKTARRRSSTWGRVEGAYEGALGAR